MIRRLPHDAIIETRVRRGIGSTREHSAIEVPIVLNTDVEEDVVAYRDGYREGFEAGERDAIADADLRLQELELQLRQRFDAEMAALEGARVGLAALTDGLAEAIERYGQSMEGLSFEIALASLTHALGSMQEDDQLMRRLCSTMAQEYRAKATRICVAPADRAALPEHLENLEISVDTDLSPGHCRVVTAHGLTESSVALRLTAIYGAMLHTLGVSRP